MYCNNCGHKNDDTTKFCVECGSKLEKITEIIPQKKICNTCGNEIVGDSKFCEKCGSDLTNNNPQKSHKKLGKIIIALIVVIALACSAVFGYATLSNPVVKLKSAIQNTIGAKSAEFEMSIDDGYDEIDADGAIELDMDERYFSLYLDIGREGEGWIRYKDSNAEMYYREDGELIEQDDYYLDEMEDAFEMYFDALEGKIDSSSVRDFMEDNGYDEVIRINDLENEGKKLAKKLVSKENLKNVLGYEKRKNGSETIYSFEPDLYELIIFLIDEGESLFTPEGYDEIRDAKMDIDLDDIPEINMNFIVKGKYLVGYELESEEIDVTFRLNNINKAHVDFPN